MKLLFVVLFVFQLASGAIAVVGTTPTPVGGSGTQTTASYDSTGATLCVIWVSTLNTDATAATISDSKSNTWTALAEASYLATRRGAFFYSHVTSVGSGHTFSGAATSGAIAIFPSCWSGTATSSSFDKQAQAGAASDTLATGSVTPDTNGELLITGIGEYNAGLDPYSIDSSFTILTKLITAAVEAGAVAYFVQTSAGAINPTWTGSVATGKCVSIATFRPPAAGSSFIPTLTVIAP